jgi:transcriptional regulator with XRE-family HTH domain
MSHHQQLKRERELRGWSQAKVARAIGTTPNAVSRWENNLFAPSPYFREQLCLLFEKNASEPGLLKEQQKEELTTQEREMVSVALDAPPAKMGWYDPTVPFSLATGLIGHDEELHQVKQRLRSDRRRGFTSFYGIPGVGKTALAVELIHDQEVRDLFPDGVLWAGLGPQPHVLSHLSRWATIVELSQNEIAKLHTKQDWGQAIRAAIGTLRVLLVIDDAWTLEDALALRIGGPNCAHLLTTRFPRIACQFANEGTFHLQELRYEESLSLLTSLYVKV